MRGKILAAVCHGPNALASLKTSDGSPLIRDKNLTGFSSDEEEMVGLVFQLFSALIYLYKIWPIEHNHTYTKYVST